MMSETYEKEKLLEQYNEDLKKQVLQRSEALLKEQQTVEEEKQKVMRLSLEKEVDQMKMKALRAQMKPHFLFNALNAIRAMIIKENPHQAYDYLTDFSRLVRYILESSEHNYVSLAEELKMIDIYVRIEQMRGSENFVFEKNIDSDINLSQVEIPPLIFQPFLENSIVHAFDQSTPEQLLELNINQVEDQLKVVVIDNGKGRSMEKTAVIHEGKNKSMATDLTRQRLELLNFQKSSLQIIDLKDDYDKPSGTQVILNLPIIINGKKIKSTIS
jgi:LytS/YehU family sensor histidine kinase